MLFVIGGFLPAGLNLIFIPIFTQYLSPEEFGIYAYTNAFQSIFIVISTLSINSYLLRFYFEKDDKSRREMFGTIFIFLTLISLIILSILILVMPRLVPEISEDVPFKPYFLLMILTVFFEYIYVIPQVIWRVKKQALTFLIFAFTRMLLIQLLALLLIVYWDFGILGRYWANIVISAGLSLFVIKIIASHSRFIIKIGLLKEALRFSIPILPAALLGVIYNAIDKIILVRYLSLDQLGLYSVAAAIGFAILISSQGYYKAIEPVIFESFNTPRFSSTIKNINKFQILALFSISLIIAAFSKELVTIFFSEPFYDSYRYIPFFLIAFSLNASRNIVSTSLHAYKITKLDFPIVIISLFFYIVSFYTLVPFFGVIGALFSLVISAFISLIASVWFIKKYIQTDWYIAIQLLLSVFILLVGVFNELDLEIYYYYELMIKSLLLLIYIYFVYKSLKRNPELIPR